MKAALLLGIAFFAALPAQAGLRPPGSVLERKVRRYEEAERANPTPPGAVVFSGSSSIEGWSTLARDFPEMPVVNRGLSGTTYADLVKYAARLFTQPEPRAIVLYSGDNDLASGATPEKVRDDAAALIGIVRARHPEACVILLAVKASPSRERLLDAIKAVNTLLERLPDVVFADTFTPLLDERGRPDPRLFRADGLHLNAEGYALWTPVVREKMILPASEDLRQDIRAAF